MSLGGVNESKKHGGAHVKSADPCLSSPERFIDTASLTGNENSVTDGERNQDGVSKIHDSEEGGLGENLPFLPEFLDSYDTAVVENNTEWLKARLKNFSQVDFDLGNQTTSDDTLEFPGISIDSKVILQNCENVSDSTHTVVTHSSAESLAQVNGYVTPFLSLPQAEESEAPKSVALSTLENVITSPVDSNNVQVTNMGQVISFSNYCLSKSKIVIQEDDILPIIPQDGQLIPDTDTIFLNSSESKLQWQPVTASSSQNIIVAPQKQGTILLNQNNGPIVVNSQNGSENLALTTISIATDKSSNLTKILVNTSQGQQLYQLNISDLKQIQSGINKSQDVNKPVTVFSPQLQASNQGFIFVPDNSGIVTAQQVGAVSNLSVKENGNAEMIACSYPRCGKLFKTESNLKVHSLSHTGDRPYKCTEPGCDWSFTKAYKLKRHEESHRGNKDFVCEICNKKFTTIYNLKTHSKQHERPRNEECPVGGCEEKFQTRRELDKHMKTHEGIEKTYKCPYEGCDKLFMSPYCLGSHPRVHQSEPHDLTCQFEGCGRKFDKLCRLKQHERVHTGERPYVCHFTGCTWAFSTASKLTRHMTKHTNKRKWICKECGKAFLRAEHLKGHMITHSGMKPFECPVVDCFQKFGSKSSVYVHIKRHEKAKTLRLAHDKPVTYHCPMDMCDKKYNSKAKLRQHILKHFPGTSKPEDAATIEILPLFNSPQSSEPQRADGKTTVVQPVTVAVKTAQDGSITNIDPLEFMAATIDVKDNICPSDSSTTQNHFTAELTAELTSVMANSIPVSMNMEIEESVEIAKAELVNTEQGKIEQEKSIFPKAGAKRDPKICERKGSARTDFHSNQMLSDRAKKRRKLLRDKAEGRAVTEDLSVSHAEDGSVGASSSQLSSHGITFRDPTTGVLYVQMQLLQDDPPHPDLYTEDSVLNSHLDMSHGSEHSEDDESEHHSSDFVGSTINLQDLVG